MDFGKVLRSTRSARRVKALPVRRDDDLDFLETMPESAGAILLDTCVYIDQLQGRLPTIVEARITSRSLYHSSIALAEICFPFGRLDPEDARTTPALAAIEDLITAINPKRLLTISTEAQCRGAVLAGVLARTLGYSDAERRRCLMDALLAAQAVEEQLLLVTRNVADFDRLSQLDSRLRVAFYRR